jgi:hypothetical protein
MNFHPTAIVKETQLPKVWHLHSMHDVPSQYSSSSRSGNTKQEVFIYVYVYTTGGLFMGNENKRSISSSTCNYCDIQFSARSKWLAPIVFFSAFRIRSDKT